MKRTLGLVSSSRQSHQHSSQLPCHNHCMGYLIAALVLIQSVSSTDEVAADYQDLINPVLLHGLYAYDDYSPPPPHMFLWKRMASDVINDDDEDSTSAASAASPEVVEKRGDSMWKFRGGKRGDAMWKFRGGKRDMWKLRTGKRSNNSNSNNNSNNNNNSNDVFKRDSMWKLRGGKRSGGGQQLVTPEGVATAGSSYKRHWKLRQGK